jgi:hypothetical protein
VGALFERWQRLAAIAAGLVGIAATVLPLLIADGHGLVERALAEKRDWSDVPPVHLGGGLALYWSVLDGNSAENSREAYERGFSPLTLVNTYADYPGNQKESLYPFVANQPHNPWAKPPQFERIIRRNIDIAERQGLFIHDLEFQFEENVTKVWGDRSVRAASKAASFEAFEDGYFKEWASWFALPCKWAKEQLPGTKIAIYGPQAFHRDYWGISGKSAQQIDGSHASDYRIWQHIDPFVDVYLASIYVFYNKPDSLYYMAANVEENYQRTRTRAAGRPLYAYVWLRYHPANRLEGNREVDDHLAEAMAILPFFSGAKGLILFGYEPQLKAGRPYVQLALFMQHLKRLERLSDKIGSGRLVIDEAAHELWNARQPLIRRIEAGPAECIVMAVNPWQSEGAVSSVEAHCGEHVYRLNLHGGHVTLAYLANGLQTDY